MTSLSKKGLAVPREWLGDGPESVPNRKPDVTVRTERRETADSSVDLALIVGKVGPTNA